MMIYYNNRLTSRILLIVAVVTLSPTIRQLDAFAPSSFTRLTTPPQQQQQQQQQRHNPRDILRHTTSPSSSSFLKTPTSTSRHLLPTPIIEPSSSSLLTSLTSTTNLLSFSDQGQNLAGIFFQASLLPYLLFLYFLGFRGNRTPALGNFGFQFLLLFVLATIPSGIISKGTYGCSLANVDWLHGGAEALLTITSLLVVFGFRTASTNANPPEDRLGKARTLAFGGAGLFAAACVLGPKLGFGAHSPFLFGLGGLPSGMMNDFSWVTHSEPINALSMPTWAIHFSSVFEWIFAMGMVWSFSSTTSNPKWKGLTWGMLPLHASGIAACTYHFFYNNPNLQFMVSLQAGLTLLGNITCAIAAYRIAVSNGWTIKELNPFPQGKTSVEGIRIDELSVLPYEVSSEPVESEVNLLIKLGVLTFVTSYIIKYGELGLNIPFESNPALWSLLVFSLPVAITATTFAQRSKYDNGEETFLAPLFQPKEDVDPNKPPPLSFSDVKKYGVAGTVAYVITELAFWAVAFPVASASYYQTAGHWPDVIHEASDRATVLGFIFAGANIARLAVPLRLGAALALAPWVDENIINRGGGDNSGSEGGGDVIDVE